MSWTDLIVVSLASSLDVNMTASLASSLADQMDVILADKFAEDANSAVANANEIGGDWSKNYHFYESMNQFS